MKIDLNKDIYTKDKSSINKLKLLMLTSGAAAIAGLAAYTIPKFSSSVEQDVGSSTLVQSVNNLDAPSEETESNIFDDEIFDSLTDFIEKDTQRCAASPDKVESPGDDAHYNVETLLHGYNIFMGSPFAKADQGFSRSALFKFDWAKAKRDTNGKSYPREANVRTNMKCSAGTSTRVMKDASDVQKSFQQEVSASGSGSYGAYSGSFQASVDFQESSQEMKTKNQASALATASCTMYTYSIKKIKPPCLSSDSQMYLDLMMEDPSDTSLMNEFFDGYGTHAILAVDMGGKFVAKTSFSAQTLSNKKADSLDVAFSAEGGGFGFSASASSHTNTGGSSFTKNGQMSANSEYYSIGTSLPALDGTNLKGQIDAWVVLSKKPEAILMPVGNMQIEPIHEILKKYYLSLDLWDDQKHQDLVQRLKEHGDLPYCQHLVRLGKLDSCDPAEAWGLPSPDNVQQPIHNLDWVTFEVENTGKGIRQPITRKGYPGGRIGLPAPHQILGYGQSSADEIIQDGNVIGIQSQPGNDYPEYLYLYSANSGATYYNCDWLDYTKAQWRIKKADLADGSEVRDGDKVKLYNVNWPSEGLYTPDSDYLESGSSISEWVIRKQD